MARLCEITRQKTTPMELIEGKVVKKPTLLKRKIPLKELECSVRLWVSENGVKVLQEQGGLGAYLAKAEEKSLSAKLKKIREQLPEVKKRLALAKQAQVDVAVTPATKE